MKRIYKFLLTVILLLSVTGCEESFIKDKEFSMKTTSYIGNELRIDGYYYKNYIDDKADFLMFYSNGVFSKYSSTLFEFEDKLHNPNYIKNLQDCRKCWGPYQIEGNTIKFEFYDIFGNYWHTCIAHCMILNDSTFNIEKITFSKTGEEVNVNKEGTSYYFLGKYHFKPFSPKPDSTNVFIK